MNTTKYQVQLFWVRSGWTKHGLPREFKSQAEMDCQKLAALYRLDLDRTRVVPVHGDEMPVGREMVTEEVRLSA